MIAPRPSAKGPVPGDALGTTRRSHIFMNINGPLLRKPPTVVGRRPTRPGGAGLAVRRGRPTASNPRPSRPYHPRSRGYSRAPTGSGPEPRAAGGGGRGPSWADWWAGEKIRVRYKELSSGGADCDRHRLSGVGGKANRAVAESIAEGAAARSRSRSPVVVPLTLSTAGALASCSTAFASGDTVSRQRTRRSAPKLIAAHDRRDPRRRRPRQHRLPLRSVQETAAQSSRPELVPGPRSPGVTRRRAALRGRSREATASGSLR